MENQGHKFTNLLSCQSKDSINIFILIDALGWQFIKDRPFLDDVAVTKLPIKSIFGFSSGVIPSILTGKYPEVHKHWSLYFYSPKTSPFKWTKGLLWIPKKILNSRISRKIIEEISKRIMGYSGYFETYLISAKKLHLFDICENKNIYAPRGIKDAETIFDILMRNNINYLSFTYPLKDKQILLKTKQALRYQLPSVIFLYLSELDALLHRACNDSVSLNTAIDNYEKEIKEIYETAKEEFETVNLFVFSDHGMAPVKEQHDLKKEIEDLRLNVPEDYIAFYDSTMARFWFFKPDAKEKISQLLKHKEYGRILSEEEKRGYGIDFQDNMYGELVFLMNTGVVINPSFMGNKAPQGMHGYDIKDQSMDAILISNKDVKRIDDVRGFYEVMLQALRGSPLRGQSLSFVKSPGPQIKILYFLNSTVRAGVEEHVLQLIDKLDKEKFEPILVCSQKLTDLMKEDLERIRVRTYPVYIKRWRNIKEIKKFIDILKREKPDIVHSHLFFATMFAAPLAKLAGIPKVIETAHLREGWRKGIKKAYFIDRFFYRYVDRIIAVSNAVKKYLIEEKKLPESKIEVIHNGVDLEKFKPSEKSSPNKEFRIGVIGRLEPQKGHKYFLEAVKMLDGKYEGVKYVIVGEGSLRKKLEEQCEEFGISDKAEFLGFRKDIVSVLGVLDLVVLPSLYEGLPLVALEVGAMGKPLIVTDVDGSREVVQNRKTGLIVPPKDALALKEAMETFIKQRSLSKELGSNAYLYIVNNFNILSQISNTEKLYQELI